MSKSQTTLLLAQAVYNNAVWCDTVCCAHGQPGVFSDTLWINRRETPPYYPNAVTLTDEATAAQNAAIAALADTGLPGAWAVKDSYCRLDLTSLCFRTLFEATWIAWSTAGSRTIPSTRHRLWRPVRTAAELLRWEAAWRGDPAQTLPATPPVFLPSLLAESTVAVLAAYEDSAIVAGAIAQRSAGVVGLSNVFVPAADDASFRVGCLATVSKLFPSLPIVGYEVGDDLTACRVLGCEALGPLRVWVRECDAG